MRIVCAKEALPHSWNAAYPGGETILFERDIKLNSLYMKLLVFKNPKMLRRFWRGVGCLSKGGILTQNTLAAVAPLTSSVYNYDKTQWPDPYLEVDRRYFSAMCLSRGHIGVGIITHESVHVAFNYSDRRGSRGPWTKEAGGDREELVCYPAGEIARLVVNALYDAGFYKDGYIKKGTV